MSKTTNKFSPEVRQHVARLVLDHEHEHPSRWAVIGSVAARITALAIAAWNAAFTKRWSCISTCGAKSGLTDAAPKIKFRVQDRS